MGRLSEYDEVEREAIENKKQRRKNALIRLMTRRVNEWIEEDYINGGVMYDLASSGDLIDGGKDENNG